MGHISGMWSNKKSKKDSVAHLKLCMVHFHHILGKTGLVNLGVEHVSLLRR